MMYLKYHIKNDFQIAAIFFSQKDTKINGTSRNSGKRRHLLLNNFVRADFRIVIDLTLSIAKIALQLLS